MNLEVATSGSHGMAGKRMNAADPQPRAAKHQTQQRERAQAAVAAGAVGAVPEPEAARGGEPRQQGQAHTQ